MSREGIAGQGGPPSTGLSGSLMRAVIQHGVHDVRVGKWPRPSLQPGEVLIRVRSVTICASDIHVFAEGNVGGVSWDEPFVPGHEAAGTVVDSNGTHLAIGTPVVLDPAAACRACDMCADGLFHLCRNLRFLDLPPVHGAMRELVAWPAVLAFPVPEGIDLVEAPLIEPLCIAVHALELASKPAGAVVLVAGCGAIGLLTIRLAKIHGADKVVATDLIPERLAAARGMGADAAVDISQADPVEAALQQTGGRGVDLAFEVAGPPEALQQCLGAVRPAGEVVVIGIPSEDEYCVRASELRRRELTLRFVRRQNENYSEAIELVRDGRVNLSSVLTHRFPMERAQEAFELAERKGEGAIRVAVVP